MHVVRSLRRATLVAGFLSLILVSSVFGHECYNASASAQGNLSKGQHSQAWFLIADIRELIATGSSGVLEGFPDNLSACQQEAFLAAYSQSGLPLVFTTGMKQAVGQGGVIAEHNPNMETALGGDGRGIDHFGVTGAQIDATLNASYGAAFSADCP